MPAHHDSRCVHLPRKATWLADLDSGITNQLQHLRDRDRESPDPVPVGEI
jgi:hypothetical protein